MTLPEIDVKAVVLIPSFRVCGKTAIKRQFIVRVSSFEFVARLLRPGEERSTNSHEPTPTKPWASFDSPSSACDE